MQSDTLLALCLLPPASNASSTVTCAVVAGVCCAGSLGLELWHVSDSLSGELLLPTGLLGGQACA